MKSRELEVFKQSFPELHRLTKQYARCLVFMQRSEWLVDTAMLAIGLLLAVYAFPLGGWSLESGFWFGIPLLVFIAGIVPWCLWYVRRIVRRVCRRSLPILVIFWTYWPKSGIDDVRASAPEMLAMFGVDAGRVFGQVVDRRLLTPRYIQSLPTKIREECARSVLAAS